MTTAEFIEKHEGRRKKPYFDHLGFKTIGVGWNLAANPIPSIAIAIYLNEQGEITDEMIDHLLDISIKTATDDCHKLFPHFDDFTETRKMALIDFLFNLGYIRAKTFHRAIAAINTGRWSDAAKAMRDSNYAKQVPNRAKEIIDMIETG